MDKKGPRNKKNKYHASRTHERTNQGILGKVASKLKDLFFNVWTQAAPEEQDGPADSIGQESMQNFECTQRDKNFSSKRPRLRLQDNYPSPCSSSSLCLEQAEDSNLTSSRGIKRLRLHEHSIPSCSMGVYSEIPCEQDFPPQNSMHENKRQRLRLPEENSILSETQSWLEVPNRPNLFGQDSHVPPSNVQRPLVENKESSIIMNGDDHSENSEGSASTSGCSSLVSHKDRTNCISSIILGENEAKSRRDISSQKEIGPGNINSPRMSLWSATDRSEARPVRSPSLNLTGQPSFNLSAFSSSSKLNSQLDKRVASPFYQGKTTFGGASASRRMPIAAAPYQTEKPIKNQVKFRSRELKDNYEGMSSAAKRILQTLEKMSSPVLDAKKIPNTNKSPVDLSLYLMPPKCYKPLQSTPIGPTKGPPIADISTISKLTTIKNHGQKTLRNTFVDSPSLLSKEIGPVMNDILNVPQTTKASPSLPSGGGKMKLKLNKHHLPANNSYVTRNIEPRMNEYIDAVGDNPDLPDIPIPISSLPTITFGNNTPKTSSYNQHRSTSNQHASDFVFSNPIEHVIPKASLPNTCSPLSTYNFPPPLVALDKQEDNTGKKFTFSNPIELGVPSSSASSKSGTNVTKCESVDVWKCNSCWVQNPAKATKCMCCEAPKVTVVATKDTSADAWKCNSCWIQNPSKAAKCMCCEAPKASGGKTKDAFSVDTPSCGGKIKDVPSADTWKCNSCWVQNPAKTTKCMCCETPKPSEGIIKADVSVKDSLAQSTPAEVWECDVCMVKNEINRQKCIACETLKSNKDLTGFSFRLSSEKNCVFGNTTIGSVSNSATPVNVSSGLSSTLSTTVSNTATPTTSVSVTSCLSILISKTSDSPKSSLFSSSKEIDKNSVGLSPASVKNSSVSSDITKSNVLLNQKLESLSQNPLLQAPNKKPDVSSQSLFNNSTIEKDLAKTSDSKSTENCFTGNVEKHGAALTSGISAHSASWECFSCKIQNDGDQQKCKSCNSAKTSKSLSESQTNSTLPISQGSASMPVFKFGSSQSTPVSTLPLGSTPSFSFGTNKESPVSNADSLEKAPSKPTIGGFNFATTNNSSLNPAASVPVFQFNSAVKSESLTWKCPDCLVNNDKNQQKCSGCNKPQSVENSSDTSKVTQISSTGLQPNTTTSSTPLFQFGKQSSMTSSSTSNFPATSATFALDKKESSNQLPAFSQSVAPGTTPQSIFGSSSSGSLVFGKTSDKTSSSAAFGQTSDKPAVGIFTFGSAAPNPAFQFGSKASSDNLWECSNCHVKNDSEKQRCISCDSARNLKNASDILKTSPSSNTALQSNPVAPSGPVFQFSTQSSATNSAASAFPSASATFTFGDKKEVPNPVATQSLVQGTTPQSIFGNSGSSSLVFGKTSDKPASVSLTFGQPSDKPAAGIFTFGSTTPNPVFQFGSKVQTDNLWECSNCHVKNDSEKQKCISCDSARHVKNASGSVAISKSAARGFDTQSPAPAQTFQFGNQSVNTNIIAPTFGASNTASSNATTSSFVVSTNSVTSTFGGGTNSTASTFGMGTNAASSTFGAGKSPATSTFGTPKIPAASTFGAGTNATTSTFGAGTNATASAFGAGTNATASAFGAASNTFTFGAKTGAANSIQPTPATQTPTPAFGSAPSQNPLFGNTNASPAFGKQAPGGFNFGLPGTSSAAPVFQFGAPEKKTAASSGFSFGTPSQDTANFQPQFNVNTPPSFNFGASSAPGPFQFAAENTQHSSSPRRIRKAVRRMK